MFAAAAVASTPSLDPRAARLEKFRREQLIVDYLNRGVSVAEIAVRIGVGEKRIRAVIRDILARRAPAPPDEFLAIQTSRLNEALLVAYSAMTNANLEAVDRPQDKPSRLDAPAEGAMAFGAALLRRAYLPSPSLRGAKRRSNPRRRLRPFCRDCSVLCSQRSPRDGMAVHEPQQQRKRPLDRRASLAMTAFFGVHLGRYQTTLLFRLAIEVILSRA